MKKTTQILFALAALLVLGACSAEPSVQHEFDDTKYFQKITAKMSLEHGYLRLDYTLGLPNQTMTFLLKNLDVSADRWRQSWNGELPGQRGTASRGQRRSV